MSKKSSEKSKSTDGGTTAGNETLAVTYEQLKTLVNDVVEKDFGPQIMKSTKDTVKAASVQSAENQSTNLAKLKKKLEKKRANDNIVLKKTGHQDQFAHNTAVLETIEDTLEFMEETDVDGMKEALNKASFFFPFMLTNLVTTFARFITSRSTLHVVCFMCQCLCANTSFASMSLYKRI
ncbi:uncharacterized protein [Clytia hemisphaerica]|uniref:uncharacterized protein n=1 Tax=Clytia hemisphaerica TaxID=252671 RepID=UPI0034D7393E